MLELLSPQYSLSEQLLLSKCNWSSQQKNIWATVEKPGLADRTQQMRKAIDTAPAQFPSMSPHNDSAAGVLLQWCVLAHIALFSAMKSTTASVIFQVLEQNLSPGRHYIRFQMSWRKLREKGVKGKEPSMNEPRNSKLETIAPIQTIVKFECKPYSMILWTAKLQRFLKLCSKVQNRKKNYKSFRSNLTGKRWHYGKFNSVLQYPKNANVILYNTESHCLRPKALKWGNSFILCAYPYNN